MVLVTVVRAALHEDQVVGGGDLHVAPVELQSTGLGRLHPGRPVVLLTQVVACIKTEISSLSCLPA